MPRTCLSPAAQLGVARALASLPARRGASARTPAAPCHRSPQTKIATIAMAATHKLATAVDYNDTRMMDLALSSAKIVGGTLDIESVTCGPRLHTLRADQSPRKARKGPMSRASPAAKFIAGGNTPGAVGRMGLQRHKPRTHQTLSEERATKAILSRRGGSPCG
jgi:hypothetical protein